MRTRNGLGQRDGAGQGFVRWAARHSVGRARGAVDVWPVRPGGLDQIVEWTRSLTGTQQQAEPQPDALPPPRSMVEDHAAAERHEPVSYTHLRAHETRHE